MTRTEERAAIEAVAAAIGRMTEGLSVAEMLRCAGYIVHRAAKVGVADVVALQGAVTEALCSEMPELRGSQAQRLAGDLLGAVSSALRRCTPAEPGAEPQAKAPRRKARRAWADEEDTPEPAEQRGLGQGQERDERGWGA